MTTDLPIFTNQLLEGLPSADKLLDYYTEDLPAQVNQLEQALRNGNYAQVGNLAHSLKSSSRQIGALRVGEAAFLVEQGARSTPTAADLPTRIQALADCATATLTAIASHRQMHK